MANISTMRIKNIGFVRLKTCRRSNVFVFIGFLLFVFSTLESIAQTITTIPLWTKEIPGSINSSTYLEDTTMWGEVVFATKVSVPSLTVYLPDKAIANGTAVVICPGGGYSGVAMEYEGTEAAKWLNSLGVAAIVLKYRLPSDEIMKDKSIGPLQDVQEAMRVVRRNSEAWGINPSRIGVIGFSAGGHLASSIATHYNDKVYNSDSTSARPDFSILIYPVISMREEIMHKGSRDNLLGKNPEEKLISRFSNDEQATPDTPPAILIHSLDDNAVPVQNSIRYLLALKKNNVKCELHIYETGGHGYSISKAAGTCASWPKACEIWLKANGFL